MVNNEKSNVHLFPFFTLYFLIFWNGFRILVPRKRDSWRSHLEKNWLSKPEKERVILTPFYFGLRLAPWLRKRWSFIFKGWKKINLRVNIRLHLGISFPCGTRRTCRPSAFIGWWSQRFVSMRQIRRKNWTRIGSQRQPWKLLQKQKFWLYRARFSIYFLS